MPEEEQHLVKEGVPSFRTMCTAGEQSSVSLAVLDFHLVYITVHTLKMLE